MDFTVQLMQKLNYLREFQDNKHSSVRIQRTCCNYSKKKYTITISENIFNCTYL